ncbi:MAG: VOC family protein [Bacteroidota bacterium]
MKPDFKRLDHIQICIPKGKEDVAKNFYIGTLGLKEIPKPEYLKANGGFWLEIADIQLHIGVEQVIHQSKRHPAFEVGNLEKAKVYLKKNDVKIKEDRPLPGYNRCSIFDPFGNRIELLGKLP